MVRLLGLIQMFLIFLASLLLIGGRINAISLQGFLLEEAGDNQVYILEFLDGAIH